MDGLTAVGPIVTAVGRLFSWTGEGRRRAERNFVAANQALLTLRSYWLAIMKYGRNKNRLLQASGTEISEKGLQLSEIGFAFIKHPELMTRLHDTEVKCRATIKRINRFDGLRPNGEHFSVATLGEFKAIQPDINSNMMECIPALIADTRDLHAACAIALGNKAAKNLISLDYLNPPAADQ